MLRSFLGLTIALTVSVQGAFAQRGAGGATPTPAPGGSTAPGGGSVGGGGINNPGGNTNPGLGTPRIPQDQTQQMPEMQRSIYLSGKVLMDDGTPPPEQVVVERVCNGNPRPEGYTDSKGRFSFALGQNSSMMADASVGSMGGSDMGMGGLDRTSTRGGGGNMGGMGNQRGVSERDLMGCEIRASLAGFRSDVVNLSGRRSMDNPDVGVIVLHRMAKVEGYTFSGTSAYAPKDAKKAYDKGRDLMRKNKLPEAEKELQKAVDSYPKYAVAWYELGLVHQQQKQLEGAKKCYLESLKADSKFVSPYAQLTRLSVADQNWEQTAEYSGKLLKLNPYFSPEVYFYGAVANLNLKNLDEAEEQAREGLKMDPKNRNPRMNQVLGVVLAQKQDFKGAAESMKSYLKLAPNAADVDHVKRQLEEIERQLAPEAASATKQPE
ncbi:MAG: tetratricopeptide repeat protein [Bryobacteraceae bacterium]